MSEAPALESLEPQALRRAFACFPSGVTAVCAMIEGQPAGMAASSFTSVSLDPPLVSVCVARTSTTWPLLARAERLGVSVLSDAHCQVARALSAKGVDRFAGVSWQLTEHGAIVVHGSTLWLSCTVYDSFAAGDHDVVLLRILSLRSYPEVAPMVFHGSAFRSLAPARS
jgi:flavin reductase (DIM6/NTAB) family NADH-FMN oxidoreductase RutF